MITYDSLIGGKQSREEQMQEITDHMDTIEIRQNLLGSILDVDAQAKEFQIVDDGLKYIHELCKNYAIVARRASDDDIRKLNDVVISKCSISEFVNAKLPELTVDEPGDMSTIEHMETILGHVVERYKKYVETGELDPLLTDLTPGELYIRLTMPSATSHPLGDTFMAWSIILNAVMYTDETLMFYDAPTDIAREFINRGIGELVKIGPSDKLKNVFEN